MTKILNDQICIECKGTHGWHSSTCLRFKEQQWEYDIVILSIYSDEIGILNQQGKEGWELVCINNGRAYFKRTKC